MRWGLTAYAAAVLTLSMPCLRAQLALFEGSVESLNLAVEVQGNSSDSRVRWKHNEERLGSKYLRFHFGEISDSTSAEYKIVINDRNGRPVEWFSSKEFQSKESFWTGLIQGIFASIEVVS